MDMNQLGGQHAWSRASEKQSDKKNGERTSEGPDYTYHVHRGKTNGFFCFVLFSEFGRDSLEHSESVSY